jgi:micrococcal nuclease
VLLVLFVYRQWQGPQSNYSPHSLPPGQPVTTELAVRRVVDGDTILFEPDMRVRLIGVNAPESVKPDSPVEPFGPEASAFTKEFLRGGTAQLEYDREKFDQYGRPLAYVWVGDRMLNEELLRAGLARWERNYNYSGEKKQVFRAAEQEARDAKRGIWSPGRSL